MDFLVPKEIALGATLKKRAFLVPLSIFDFGGKL